MTHTSLISVVRTEGYPCTFTIQNADWAGDALLQFLAKHREALNRDLHETGAVLLRGLPISNVDTFEIVAEALLGTPTPYRGGIAPRIAERGNVYRANGPDCVGFVAAHNELSYAPWHPNTLLFGCARPADSGGATVLWDGRRVFAKLSPEVAEDFQHRGVMYVQHLPNEATTVKSWRQAFESDNRDEVYKYCVEQYTSAEWTEIGLLTTNITPAVLVRDGHQVWFNQAQWLQQNPAQSDITDFEAWRNHLGYGALFGDGAPIPVSHLEEIAVALEDCAVPVHWEAGDILLVDNELSLHGREPFTGPRQVFVAFA